MTTTTVTVTYRPPGHPDDDTLRAASGQLREHLQTIQAEPGVVRTHTGWLRPPWSPDDVTVSVAVTLEGLATYRNHEHGRLLADRAVYLAGGTGLGLSVEHVDRVEVRPVKAEVPAGV